MKVVLPFVLALVGVGVFSALRKAPQQEQVEHYNVAFDVAPRGDKIVFSAADGDLYLFNLTTRAVSRLTRTGATESTPTFSPDGKWIAYSSKAPKDNGNHIFIRSLDGKTVQQLTTNKEVSDYQPSFSADGSRIVFVRASRYRAYSMGGMTWSNYDVCTMKKDGTGTRQLTQQKYYSANWPHFIDGGKTIVYGADVSRGTDEFNLITQLLVVPVQGGQKPRVLPTLEQGKTLDSQAAVLGSEANVSGDGRRLVFLSDQTTPYHYDFYVMDANGTNIKPLQVNKISAYNQNAVFTPGGKSVLFLAGTETNAGGRAIFSLWMVGVNGKNAKRVADTRLFTNPPTWKPKP